MDELFNDISEEVRRATTFWLDMCFHNPSPFKGIQMLNDYGKTLTEHERDYLDFCFQTRLIREEASDEENLSN